VTKLVYCCFSYAAVTVPVHVDKAYDDSYFMLSQIIVLSIADDSSGASKLLIQQHEDPQVTGANRCKYFRRSDFT